MLCYSIVGRRIRNFLTLFLSIEVSKAMLEAADAKAAGDDERYNCAQKKLDCFTNQLNESNPILTEISDAMTLEGHCKEKIAFAELHKDDAATTTWRAEMEKAAERKADGNNKLMACSARYQAMMRSIREAGF